jgi:hypothetical protein
VLTWVSRNTALVSTLANAVDYAREIGAIDAAKKLTSLRPQVRDIFFD